ncbi:MAG: PH domain-containing protein [Gammaproteobacteria bacterium]
MGYVSNNLLPEEDIIHLGKVHWFVLVPGFIFLIIGFNVAPIEDESGGMFFIGFLMVLYGFVRTIDAIIKIYTTELAITSKRVIAKIGLIRRETIELNHNKVESFKVDQSILGRIFGFGTLTINGTGGVQTPIKTVTNPLDFRRKAMEITDQS